MDMGRQVQAVIRLPKLRTKMLHKMEKGGLSRLFHAVLTDSELVNFSVTPAEEGASGFVTAVAAR